MMRLMSLILALILSTTVLAQTPAQDQEYADKQLASPAAEADVFAALCAMSGTINR